MSQAGLEPDSETYRALLCGYAKNGLFEELNDTLRKKTSILLFWLHVLKDIFF